MIILVTNIWRTQMIIRETIIEKTIYGAKENIRQMNDWNTMSWQPLSDHRNPNCKKGSRWLKNKELLGGC